MTVIIYNKDKSMATTTLLTLKHGFVTALITYPFTKPSSYYFTNTIITNLLTNIIQQCASTILTYIDAMLITPLHVLCYNPTVLTEMIQTLKGVCPDATPMRSVMGGGLHS
jgi:hypothetical protein